MRVFAALCRWLLGAVFVVAGVMKMGDPAAFIADVEGYRLVGGVPAVEVAFFVPWLEVVAGLGLIAKKPYRGAVLVVAVLLAAFVAALVQAWVRGLDIECGCFGGDGGRTNYPWWVARDLLLLAAAIVCWRDAMDTQPRMDAEG